MKGKYERSRKEVHDRTNETKFEIPNRPTRPCTTSKNHKSQTIPKTKPKTTLTFRALRTLPHQSLRHRLLNPQPLIQKPILLHLLTRPRRMLLLPTQPTTHLPAPPLFVSAPEQLVLFGGYVEDAGPIAEGTFCEVGDVGFFELFLLGEAVVEAPGFGGEES